LIIAGKEYHIILASYADGGFCGALAKLLIKSSSSSLSSISSILAAIGLDSQAKAGDRISCKRLGLKTAKIVEAIKMKVSWDLLYKKSEKVVA